MAFSMYPAGCFDADDAVCSSEKQQTFSFLLRLNAAEYPINTFLFSFALLCAPLRPLRREFL